MNGCRNSISNWDWSIRTQNIGQREKWSEHSDTDCKVCPKIQMIFPSIGPCLYRGNAISRRIMDFSVTVYFVILNHLIANSICERNQVLIINIQFDFAYARVSASLHQLFTHPPPPLIECWLRGCNIVSMASLCVCVCNSLSFSVFNMIFSSAAAGVPQYC